MIGVVMFSELQHIDYGDKAVKFSAFFIVLGMPLTYSITDGLLLGAVVFAFVRIAEGRYREIGMAMSILAAVALLVFFVL
jgi:AGZA family xanthine/uracil permease-like MFS transporter